jgi:membrane fusion protein, copper/silver efflux system
MKSLFAALLAAVGLVASAHGEEPARAAIRLEPGERQATGIVYGAAERRALEKVIRTVGRLDVDERKLVDVTVKIGGYVERLFADFTGKPVREGEPLLSIYSPDLVSAEQEYLLARRTEQALEESRLPSAPEAAASLVRASRERLRLWGLTDGDVRRLEAAGQPSLRHTVRAPASGVVLEKRVVAGQRFEPGATLYRIADLSTIWVYGEIYERDLPFVRVGQAADIRLAYAPGRAFSARLAYVYPTLDEKTRTARVRFELPNAADDLLRPQMFADVELRVPLGERLVVPKDAVLDSGRRQLVFVAAAGGSIVPRDVRVGERVDDYVEIVAGLAAGERVVTSANFLVDSESQIRGARSMSEMMGAVGMADWRMESAKPMSMEPGAPAQAAPPAGATTPADRTPEEQRVGDLLVALFPAEGAPGEEATVRLRVRDAGGAPVTDAAVSLDYTMDMPGMKIERAEARAAGGGLYEARARLAMAGPWSVVVEIHRPGKPSLRGRFTLRVGG